MEKHHLEWKYKLRNVQRMNNFVQEIYSVCWDSYQTLSYDIQYCYAICYLILNEGVYVDFDYKSLEPVDSLLFDRTCDFSLEHFSIVNLIFNNTLMTCCVQGHFFRKKIIEYVFSNVYLLFAKSTKGDCIVSAPCSWMLMKLYNQLIQEEKQDAWLMPVQYITPLNWQTQFVRNNQLSEYKYLLREVYTVHYFCSTY
jgi:mannosyltransferase OCH1-like enzyme